MNLSMALPRLPNGMEWRSNPKTELGAELPFLLPHKTQGKRFHFTYQPLSQLLWITDGSTEMMFQKIGPEQAGIIIRAFEAPETLEVTE